MNEEPTAWHHYEISGYPEDETVTVTESTNDNLDTGYPSESAHWSLEFRSTPGKSGYEKALAYAGKSRVGISGVVVRVGVNGREI